ncbi:sce7725 family protein [Paenarthrobacter aurescens]|uniref:sce7725 family protein n=1 Tax=Paenarthrobacter aurescens TaxID=43663 RepID=UPI0021C03C88|nr:sce7725 family protein [Paenarthrobacter aurescens]MCT9871623.1 sce7725 family protein [Paenarthrobacter aurescens]
MYHPYFRGKQFELIAIRESADLISSSGFVPIIEPVRESLGGLQKAVQSLCDAGAQSILVVNPRYGDHKANGDSISALLARDYCENDAVGAGILLTSETSLTEASRLIGQHPEDGTALIHAGFTEPRALSELLGGRSETLRHIFIDAQTNMLYMKHFSQGYRTLIRDGFERKKNADYDHLDMFSDMHVTYTDRGMNGYGDFLTVGDNYSEGGGPAYAVAIHMTFIDPDQDDAMFVYHFKSDSNDTPTDPAKKFSQALNKLIAAADQEHTRLLDTTAVREFRDLHARGHFPGLGYVKKLSIKHHLETLADFHSRATDV